ncbi:MAG: DsbE family thiol:disulfide interchange protein, partial [Cellvibrionaceae bacterium]|nr:DsbE family thiol:disulfide interchange protein [Cellvibrionaceae bacterium]
IDKPFPKFSLGILKDPSLIKTEKDLRLRPTLINVWATWCVSCRVEHPYLVELKQQGVRIVGINYKDQTEAARKWLQDLHDPYEYSVIDQDGRLGLDLGVFGAPETYLVDTQGMIRHKHVGVLDAEVWQQDFLPKIQAMTVQGK